MRQISIRRASGNESDARMLNTSLLVSLIRVGTKYTLQSLLHKNVTSARKMLENMVVVRRLPSVEFTNGYIIGM